MERENRSLSNAVDIPADSGDSFFTDSNGQTVLSDRFTNKKADVAFVTSQDLCGGIDMKYMCQITGMTAMELSHELHGAIYQDPAGYEQHHSEMMDWFSSDEYLSGNLLKKLNKAYAVNKQTHRFQENIRALKKAMPKPVAIEKIGISLGSPWIPPAVYEEFIREILNLKYRVPVLFSKELHQWKIEMTLEARDSFNNCLVYGTERIPATRLIEKSMNAETVKIYDEVDNPQRSGRPLHILNRQETMNAQEKQEFLEVIFKEWVMENSTRRTRLRKIYNDTYCYIRSRTYDGNFLTFPDLNPSVQLLKHQRDAVARIILGGDVLLCHSVGAGKTLEIVAGFHERKRMGLSSKNMAVVPNNVLDAFADTHRQMYANDRILVIYPADFTPAKRKTVLEKIKTEDYTAIYIASSSFDLIHMSKQYYIDKTEEEIRRYNAEMEAAKSLWEKKELARKAKAASEKLVKIRNEKESDSVPAFEELGITTLAVDEAHRYKNISFDIRLEGVVGMHTVGSRKCDEMMEKVQYVRRVRKDTKAKGVVIFATATPITNSICDLYTIQKYLQPEELELLHLGGFDQWINNFAQCHTGFEIDVDSQNYRIMTRFSSFHNLPELMNLLSEVVDFYDGNDYRTDLPNCSGYTDIVVPKSPEQAAYMQSLVDRTEAVRTGKVAKDKDNLLKITHDGQAASLDIRLVDSSVCPRPENTKTAACAATIMQLLRKYPGTAQLVFCDLGTPKIGFNLYDDLKNNLIRLGMRDQEIAYIHMADTEAKRRKLFAAVNRAEIKVLIGSTAKLGLGVNIQERLIAEHRLDIPCRPSDVIQSEGRLIRRGNQNPEVFLYRYVTEGLFDAYSWQKLENKQRFYSEFMSNAYKGRSAEDLTYMVLSDAEIKAIACGNPLIKLRVETGNMLEHARIQQRSREKELSEAWNVIRRTPGILTDLKKRRTGVERDYRLYEEKKQSMSREERTVFGERLLKELAGNASNTENRIFAKVFGFHVIFPAGMDLNKPKILLKGCSENVYVVSMKEAKAAGCLQRITAVLSSLPEKSKELERNRQDMIKRCREAEKLYNEGNPYEKQIKELSEKLLQIDEELNREANEAEMKRLKSPA